MSCSPSTATQHRRWPAGKRRDKKRKLFFFFSLKSDICVRITDTKHLILEMKPLPHSAGPIVLPGPVGHQNPLEPKGIPLAGTEGKTNLKYSPGSLQGKMKFKCWKGTEQRCPDPAAAAASSCTPGCRALTTSPSRTTGS